MTYYAEIKNDKVVRVIASNSNFISKLSGEWVETFKEIDNNSRKMFAGIEMNYDRVKNQFYPNQPYPSWTKDSNNDWNPPIPHPNDEKFYLWNENEKSWDIREVNW